jgi:citrate lyase subunit beta/citryl-CoA lyase
MTSSTITSLLHAPKPHWRSILYVPAHVTRFVDAAHRRGADAIQLDLEDSVPPAQKEVARAAIASAAVTVGQSGADVLVRINRPLSQAVRDIEATVGPAVRGLSITKVDGPSHVRLLDELVSECELRTGVPLGRTCFILLIETAAAFEAMAAIVRASPRIVALSLGSEDFALDCGFAPNDDVLLMPKQQMVIAARAAGVIPLGTLGSVVNIADIAAYRAMVRRSRQFGFETATCIHPDQVAIVNEEYGIAESEATVAQRIVDESACHADAGRGAFALDGKMVDEPIVERARRTLMRYAAQVRFATPS